MINTLIVNYPVLSLITLIILIIAVGCLELLFIGRLDIACITWFWALLIIVIRVAFIAEFGIFRWFLSTFIFFIGGYLIFNIYKNGQWRKGKGR